MIAMLFSKITTLQIGGPIKKYTAVKNQDELISEVKDALQNSLEFLVIGGGSNLLVSDSGYSGCVIQNNTAGILKEGQTLKVKSGTILQDLVNFADDNGLGGLQKLTGIPGTVGGAVYGNAGAYGQTISDHIKEVKIFDGQKIVTLSKNECGFEYRDSIFKESKDVILEVTFELEPGDSKILYQEANEVLQKRLIKYPKGIKCPGSFFMNIIAENLPKEVLEKIPKNMIVYGKIPAGALLEEVGAKGDNLGAIEIANYHANLFVNKGGGKAEDFYNLAKKYFQKVKDRFGIELKPEVQLINLPSLD